ncbi:MAG: cation:proton antiporter [Bacillota bacterium]|mgnify:CR=1 FL=1
MHETTEVLAGLFLMFAAAKVMGYLAERLNQPAVVGEILAGVLIGPSVLNWVHPTEFTDLLAELAVIVLLFRVGLEVNVREMMEVGLLALGVAVVGVVLPFVAGSGLVIYALDADLPTALFMGSAMVATSVGITARVLADLGQLQRRESRTILGAAVIDDVLGLLVLAMVAGIATTGSVSWASLGTIIGLTVAFVAGVLLVGRPLMLRINGRLPDPAQGYTVFFVAVVLMLGLATLAAQIGLAAIVGAFFAGLILELGQRQHALDHQVQPVAEFLVPFFFVSVGMKVELDAFMNAQTLWLTLAVLVLAMITKVAAGWLVAFRSGWLSSSLIGVGMMPRGEVGIIVALMGLSLGVISQDLYSVVVAMSVITTIVAPPILKVLLTRIVRQEAASHSGALSGAGVQGDGGH